VNQKNTNRPEWQLPGNSRISAYQPPGTSITRRRRFTSCPLSVEAHFDEKYEDQRTLPVDNYSAISTSGISYRDELNPLARRLHAKEGICTLSSHRAIPFSLVT
jgi:hypothetical protein